VCETGRRAVQSPIWGRAQFGQLSYQKSKCQDIRSIDIDRARMQAGSGALGTPTGYLAHGLPPHIGADGRHGGTATAWKSAKSRPFLLPKFGSTLANCWFSHCRLVRSTCFAFSTPMMMMIYVPHRLSTGYPPPPNTAADLAHSTHSTQPARLRLLPSVVVLGCGFSLPVCGFVRTFD